MILEVLASSFVCAKLAQAIEKVVSQPNWENKAKVVKAGLKAVGLPGAGLMGAVADCAHQFDKVEEEEQESLRRSLDKDRVVVQGVEESVLWLLLLVSGDAPNWGGRPLTWHVRNLALLCQVAPATWETVSRAAGYRDESRSLVAKALSEGEVAAFNAGDPALPLSPMERLCAQVDKVVAYNREK